jgi:hypothetical protein
MFSLGEASLRGPYMGLELVKRLMARAPAGSRFAAGTNVNPAATRIHPLPAPGILGWWLGRSAGGRWGPRLV